MFGGTIIDQLVLKVFIAEIALKIEQSRRKLILSFNQIEQDVPYRVECLIFVRF